MNDEKETSSLAKALGITPVSEARALAVPIPKDDKVENDAEFARTTLYQMVSNASEAIDQLQEIARESMHPRAFEVLARLIEVNAANADKLLKIHADKQRIQQSAGESSSANTNVQINGNVAFFGTTNDLLNVIRDQQKADQQLITIETEDD